jgi:hypothetical protein
MNSGQICMSTDRIIIRNSLVETFIPRYVERVDMANNTEYGLTGGVISRDLSAALDVVSRVRSGIIHINDQGIADEPMAPISGWPAGSVADLLADEDDVDPAGQFGVDLQHLPDPAVLPVGGLRAGVFQRQAVGVDPLVRRGQRGHQLLRASHEDHLGGSPGVGGQRPGLGPGSRHPTLFIDGVVRRGGYDPPTLVAALVP